MQTRYVNLGSTAGGDGTTNNTAGADRAYASLYEGLAALTGVLSEPWTFICTKGSGGNDTTLVFDCLNQTTSAANYILIKAAAGDEAQIPHDTSRYTRTQTNDHGIYCGSASHLRIDGIQIQITVNTPGQVAGIKSSSVAMAAADIDCRVTNCVVKGIVSGGGEIYAFITHDHDAGGGGTSTVKNCFAYGCTAGFDSSFIDAKYVNCTAAHCTYSFYDEGGMIVKNGLSHGATIGFVGAHDNAASDYNAEDDGNGAPGANSHTSHTFTFANHDGNDFHLAVGDVGAQGLGIGTTDGDVPATDFDGNARGVATCDIGADEYDPGPAVLTQTQFQFFGVGDELPHMNAAIVPVIEDADAISNGNNTAETTPNITYPAHSTGDLIIQALLSDADAAHTNPGATGPNGETINQICFNQETGGTNGPHFSVVWWVATANTAGGDQIWTIASEQWVGLTIRVPAGEFYATTPIGSVSALGYNNADAGTADMPAFTPNRSGGKVVCVGGADIDPMAATYAPAGWTGIQTQDIGAVSCFAAVRDALTIASTQVDGASFDINAADSYCCIGFVVNGTISVADGRTPLDVAGTDPILNVDTDYGVSIRVENSGGATTEDTYKWQYNLNGDSPWIDITDASSVIRASATADFANGADVTEYIGGTGTYVSNNNAALDTTGTLTLAAVLGASQSFESHLNFQIVSEDVEDGDIIFLSIVYEDGTEFDSYGESGTSSPAIIVNKEPSSASASASASASYEESGSASGIEDHELTVANMALALNFGSIALTQAQTIAVANMALALNHAGVVLTQAQTIAAAGMAMALNFGEPVLTQAQTIAVANVALALSHGEPALTQAQAITVANMAMALNLEALALAQAQTLTIADIALALGFEAPVLTQVQLLSVDGMAMAPVFGEPTLTQAQTLAVANMAHGLNFDSPALIQASVLVVDGMACAVAFGEPGLMTGTVLVVNDMVLGLAFGEPTLTQNQSLTVEDMSLALVFDALGLTQAQVLAVDDMTLALLFDSITIPGTVPVVPGAGTDCATWASRDRCGLAGTKIRYLGKKCALAGPKCSPVGPKCSPVGPKPKRCPDD